MLELWMGMAYSGADITAAILYHATGNTQRMAKSRLSVLESRWSAPDLEWTQLTEATEVREPISTMLALTETAQARGTRLLGRLANSSSLRKVF